MQKILTYAWLLLALPFIAQAQTAEQRAMMRNASNTTALNQLLTRVQEQSMLEQMEVELYAAVNNVPIREVLRDGRVKVLVRILENNHPMYVVGDNTASATSIATDKVHTGELGFTLDGSGYVIGEWDGGSILATHEAMTGRVTNYNASSALSSHSTHVCGTMIGNGTGDASAKGMAPLATVDGWDFTDDDVEMVAEAAGTGQSPNTPFLVSNHSYGTVCGWSTISGLVPRWAGDPTISEVEDFKFGWYSEDARLWDEIANNAPYYLIFKSAGNDRGDYADFGLTDAGSAAPAAPADGTGASPADGYDCVSTYSNAKNIMTVGAVNDVTGGYSGPGSVVMSSFSGWGPADDGRVKPDIVANGVGLHSPDSGGDNDYGSKSGTSMATPSAAGSAILLQEHYSETHNNELMLSSTLKGLIINTADEAGNPGPDYQFGWGLMNTARAAQLISSDLLLEDHIIEGTLNDGETITKNICVGGNEPLKITLTWNDPFHPEVFSGSAALDNPTPKLINDLDLRVMDANGTVYEPWILNKDVPSDNATTGDNIVDNVEQIYIETLSPGEYTLTITHKGTLANPQTYSLISTGISNADATADAGVVDIDGVPNGIICQSNTSICPVIQVQNFTCNPLPNVSVNYQVNDGNTVSFPLGQTLSAGEIISVNIGEVALSAGADQTFTAFTTLTGGLVDGAPVNDSRTHTFTLTNPSVTTENLPLAEDFTAQTITPPFEIFNPDGADTWEIFEHADCPRAHSVTVNNYNYDAEGEVDGLVTPFYDLTNALNPTITFDLAYAPLSTNSFETLEIRALDACGSNPVTVWSRSGLALSTNGGGGIGTGSNQAATPNKWVPGCDDWATVSVDLSAFAGQVVQFGIYNINGYGNDLFIDDVNITTETCPTAVPVASLSGGGGCNTFDLMANEAPADHTYQWYNDGAPIPNATMQTYTAAAAGDYAVTFVGTCKYPLSTPITVSADATAPTIDTDCTTLHTTANVDENCQVTIPDFTGDITATDNCDTDLEINQNPVSNMLVTATHNEVIPVTITVTDDAGLSTTCTINVTATDATAPTIDTDCTTLNTMTNLDENCQITVPNLTNAIMATDNCDNEIAITQSPMAGTMADLAHGDTYDVTLTATDDAGLTATCVVTLTATDATNPVAIAQNHSVTLDGNGAASITGQDLDNNSTDNCGIVSYTANPNSFTTAGDYDVVFTVMDVAGNSAQQTVVVSVTSNDALPIELLNFSAQAVAKQSVLKWEIPANSQAVAYIVEWQTPTTEWQTIATVATKSGVTQYDFVHEKPATGSNYYRLQQVMEDGQMEYSHLVNVTFQAETTVNFFPNPTTNQVTIDLSSDFDAAQPIEVQIFNINGKLVQSTTLNGASSLDLSALTSGLYQIQLQQNGKKTQGRVLKMD